MSRRLWFPFLIALSAFLVAGCSYQPARVTPEPLIVIDDDHRRYDGYRHDRRYDDHRYDDRRRGGFCPPGLAKQGRC